ncbi:MAG: RIO1 family regulatory kinase/ATPase, partial [Desulfurococcaceae archaeon]
TAYHKASIVHGDLSEYNILVRKQDEVPFIIDWPQYVYRDDPQAVDLLKRDVSYVVKFFSKTYGVELKINEALDYVVKWSKQNT